MAPPPPPPKPEERVCILCDTALGHLPLNKFRAHIEHCLSKPSKAAIPAIPEDTNNKQTQTQTDLPDSNPDTDTDATQTDDELQDRDLPPPYTSTTTPQPATTAYRHTADAISTSKFPALTPPTTFLTALTHPTSRSTRALCAIALNTQSALLTWQDEYLSLETELARLSEHKPHRLHPRRPLDPLVFEDLKMAGLYGFKHDPHESRVGAQDPFAHLRTGRVVGGKVLRERKGMGQGRGQGQGGESDDEEVGGRSLRRAGRLRREGSETGGSRAASVVGGVRRRRKRFHDEETFEAGLSSDAAGLPRKRGRPRLNPLASRLGLLYGGGEGTTATSEATTEGEVEAEVGVQTGLKTEEGGPPAPTAAAAPKPGLPPGVSGRLNLLEAKRRGRKPKPTAAATSRLPGLAEEALIGVGGPPPKEKKRKGRPPGVFGKYWGEAAKKLKLKSHRVVDSGADS